MQDYLEIIIHGGKNIESQEVALILNTCLKCKLFL